MTYLKQLAKLKRDLAPLTEEGGVVTNNGVQASTKDVWVVSKKRDWEKSPGKFYVNFPVPESQTPRGGASLQDYFAARRQCGVRAAAHLLALGYTLYAPVSRFEDIHGKVHSGGNSEGFYIEFSA